MSRLVSTAIATPVEPAAMDAINLRSYEHLSPFEIKDELIRLARTTGQATAHVFLNAGRGNPNWIATRAREIFFLLGQFALDEATQVMAHPAGLGGMPRAAGIAGRLHAWLGEHAGETADMLIRYAVARFGFAPDTFVHELVDAITGDNYPVPDRMLVHAERVVHEYLMQAMCGLPRPPGRFDLFATEGGTAAICYIFRSLKANRLLRPGDRIALGTPIFTPYLEIPGLEDYGLEPVYVDAPQENGFQFTDAELAKLADPRVKAFFLVNPGNPTSVALSPIVRARIADLVRTQRPDLMLITDDVYATFVDDFRSLLGELPKNTIGVYSYSKYFGCTGWRLGVIAIHQDNVFDRQIADLPEADRQALDRRYGMLALEPRKLRFIDRLVADSRDVALNHTAGLSPPQQAMMTLFSLVELADLEQAYRRACTAILRRRVTALLDGLALEATPGPLFDYYYGLIDLEFWLRKYLGEDVARFVKQNVHPLDIVFRLAHDHGIVLLNGGGFHAPDWSVRVSFANLEDDVYDDIGHAVRAIAQDYVRAYHTAQQTGGAPAMPEPAWPQETI
jgi:aspartate 4-decarboxylase